MGRRHGDDRGKKHPLGSRDRPPIDVERSPGCERTGGWVRGEVKDVGGEDTQHDDSCREIPNVVCPSRTRGVPRDEVFLTFFLCFSLTSGSLMLNISINSTHENHSLFADCDRTKRR